ncbi:hypothetical protein SeD_A3055 [Salmonella enterica subsp. enterica serovar Dublin str. CT_02021853]|uniref:Uncharacterized protein n=2 Tax=Salmonella dublin TaxID=98360 RepID=A0A8X6K2F1_SALDU|nr:hypothetical protein SeD_A3055 [Salmonella enterica subsp. enterica serovar Dublin str. CT_02021853]EGE30833.1 hypothetical protein SD3246_2956 [Salmonella enterica subsp. enterica serovar Dublin str. SD3246]
MLKGIGFSVCVLLTGMDISSEVAVFIRKSTSSQSYDDCY